MKYLYIVATVIVFVIIASIVAPLAVRVVVWTVAGVTVVGGVVRVFTFIEDYRTVRANRRKAELESNLIVSDRETWIREEIRQSDGTISIEYARLGGLRLRVNSHDHNPTPSEVLFAQTQITTGQSKMLVSGALPVQTPQPVDLLSLLDRAERVLVKGVSDAGKSTLLQHIAQRGQGAMIIDPHFEPGFWPVADSRVVGAGRNYGAIDDFLSKLMIELDRRYKLRAQGQGNFEPITIIVDEFQSVREECDRAGKILSTLIRESRKVNFRLFIGSHSELVKALGLEGQGDVRDGLLIVRLGIDQITKQRTCKVDDGNGERDAYFPPFGGLAPDMVFLPGEDVGKAEEDAIFVSLVESGKSRNEASLEAYGRPYAGNLVARGKRALGELG